MIHVTCDTIHVAPTVSVPGLHLCSRMVVQASFSTPSHSILATVSHTCRT